MLIRKYVRLRLHGHSSAPFWQPFLQASRFAIEYSSRERHGKRSKKTFQGLIHRCPQLIHRETNRASYLLLFIIIRNAYNSNFLFPWRRVYLLMIWRIIFFNILSLEVYSLLWIFLSKWKRMIVYTFQISNLWFVEKNLLIVSYYRI